MEFFRCWELSTGDDCHKKQLQIPPMKRPILVLIALSIFLSVPSFTSQSTATNFTLNTELDHLQKNVRVLYQSIDFGASQKVEYSLFHRAIVGFYQLKQQKRTSDKDILSIIDFRKSGNEKRLWVIDLKNLRVLYHTLVAHGRNTGDEFARKFSNRINSNQSSLGFYVTGQTYVGKHGISLKLHGMEPAFNDKAETRAVVMHGADYVSEGFISKVGRLGRSLGCPAVPMGLHKEMIPTLANGTILFIYYPDEHYLSQTKFYNQLEAYSYLSSNTPPVFTSTTAVNESN